jgi:hypothetical protein
VGLVHRDVTPHNILVTYDGVVKIVDFGVAKATSRIAAETEAGQLKGKIAYMSPEQLRGEPIDRRTDVFAMGIVLHMLLTGLHPFRGDDQSETIRNITSDEPAKPIRKHLPGLRPALEAVVAQALAKEPARRFPSANDMLKALTRVMQPSTDEEVAEYVRGLLQDRLDKRRRAVRAALDIADEREEVASKGRRLTADVQQDDVATVVQRFLSPALSSDPDNELDSAPSYEQSLEHSVSEAARPRMSSETMYRKQLRYPALFVGAVVGVGLAAGIALVGLPGGDEGGAVEEGRSVVSARAAATSEEATEVYLELSAPIQRPEAEQAPDTSRGGEALAEKVAGTERELPQEAEGIRQTRDKTPGTSTRASSVTPAVSKPERTGPFVTPVRDPGF